MLAGAMDELRLGDPWSLDTDVGPVIDHDARRDIQDYCDRMASAGRLLKRLPSPPAGCFVAPHVLAVQGIVDVEREVFGPVLHVATFEAEQLDQVVADINERGYGLTFGLHTRIDDRVQRVVEHIHAGNIYVNRNQIGAVVGSQPFGGEGLSGTGPKAGGPGYLPRLLQLSADPAAAEVASTSPGPALPSSLRPMPPPAPVPTAEAFAASVSVAAAGIDAAAWAARADRLAVLRRTLGANLAKRGGQLFEALGQAAARADGELALPGPTGESNRLRHVPRGTSLCLGPGRVHLLAQALQALAGGGGAVLVAALDGGIDHAAVEEIRSWRALGLPLAVIEVGQLPQDADWLRTVSGVALAAYSGPQEQARALRRALARREGAILPLVTEPVAPDRFLLERVLCVDTTAAGGNASLLAASDGGSFLAASAGGM